LAAGLAPAGVAGSRSLRSSAPLPRISAVALFPSREYRAAEAGDRPVLESTDWLSVVNFFRETAGLAHLAVNGSWTPGEVAHSRYMAANRVIGHTESPGKAYYTAAGNTAA